MLGKMFRRAIRWRTYPLLCIPITRGPLLGFYHFLTGYWVPAYLLMMKRPNRNVMLLHGGPMDSWFDVLPGRKANRIDAIEGLQIGFRGRRLHFAKGYRTTVFHDWDKFSRFVSLPLREVADDVASRFQAESDIVSRKKPRVLLIGRDYVPQELLDHPYRIFGKHKRVIPNMNELKRALSEDFDVAVVDGARLAPEEMIRECLNADAIVGQHGAGLANALFLPKGSRVFEIRWRSAPQDGLGHFRELCRALGHQWVPLYLQETNKSNVDPQQLLAALRGAFEE